jgi:hypothetical protein
MADFGWFQAEARKRGKVACIICFEDKDRSEMEPVSDKPGVVWDVCKQCAETEKTLGAKY